MDDKIIIMTMHGAGETAEHVTIHRVNSAREAHLYVIATTVETGESGGRWVRCEIIEEWRKYPLCRPNTYLQEKFAEEILDLDDRSLQKLMREVDTQDWSIALKGMEDEVQARIFRNMSKRAAAMLKEDMEYRGPIPKSYRSKAHERILYQFERLVEDGKIIRKSTEGPLIEDFDTGESNRLSRDEIRDMIEKVIKAGLHRLGLEPGIPKETKKDLPDDLVDDFFTDGYTPFQTKTLNDYFPDNKGQTASFRIGIDGIGFHATVRCKLVLYPEKQGAETIAKMNKVLHPFGKQVEPDASGEIKAFAVSEDLDADTPEETTTVVERVAKLALEYLDRALGE